MKQIMFIITLLTLLLPPSVFADGDVILEADFIGTFIRENTFVFKEGSNLYSNKTGGIEGSDIDYPRPEPVIWKLVDGQSMSMACGLLPKTPMQPNGAIRFVRFHFNGEYKRGCSIINKVTFKVNEDSVLPLSGSRIELHPSGQLAYTNRTQEGTVVLNDQSIDIEPLKEIMYNDNGSLRFFTPKKGSQFKLKTEKYGTLQFEQQTSSTVSMSLFENGHIERAILGQELELKNVTLPQGSGITFSENSSGIPTIFTAILTDNLTVETSDGYSLKTKLPRFREDGSVEALVLAEKIFFTNPNNSTQSMEVFPKSQIFLDESGVISGINAVIPPEVLKQLEELQGTF